MHITVTNYSSEEKIKKIVKRHAEGRCGYLFLSNEGNSEAIFKNLESHGFARINLRDILINCRTELRQAVVEFSGALNSMSPHHNWWAIGISRRIATGLFPSGMAKIFLIKKVIDSGEWDSLVVYDDSIFPWVSMTGNKHKVQVNFYMEHSAGADWKNRLKSVLPLGTVLWLLRKIVTKTKLGWSLPKIKKDTFKAPVVLFTLIDNNSFPAGLFRDIYLGELANHIKKEGRGVFILGQLHDKLSGSLAASIKRQHNPLLFLLDHFWSISDLINVTCRVFYDYIKRQPVWSPSHFMGFNVSRFLTMNLRLDLQGAYAENLLSYRAARKYLCQIQPDLFIYPYENKCMERMLLKAIAEVCPDAQKIGYQHAAVIPKHIHMFLAPEEFRALPLPDKIVTNGPHTACLLSGQGNYPDGMIVTGTALRSTAAKTGSILKNQPPRLIKNILMVLAEGIEEYDKGFNFLRNIQLINATEKFDFRVRLHPGIPYDPFAGMKANGIRCIKDTTASLVSSLQWADLILYATTSVSVQAMACGIPAVWMDMLDFWGTDPINADNLLRWRLNSPKDWGSVISEIEHLPQEEFEHRLEKSIMFASEYFSQEPVDIKKWLESIPKR
jgi:hypothetical protein